MACYVLHFKNGSFLNIQSKLLLSKYFTEGNGALSQAAYIQLRTISHIYNTIFSTNFDLRFLYGEYLMKFKVN